MIHAENEPLSLEETSTASFAARTLSLWKWAVLAAPLWWVLGLNILIYQSAAAVLFLRMVVFSQREDRGIYLPGSCYFIFSLSVIYFFSILIHAQYFPAARVAASLYNLTYWIMGFFLIVVLSNSFSISKIVPLLKTFRSFGWILGILGLGVLGGVMHGWREVIFPTPLSGLSRYFESADLLTRSLTVELLQEDWFAANFNLRFNAFSPYPTATGGILMITLMMILTLASVENARKRPLFLFLFGINFMALLLTFARMSVMVFALSIGVVFLLQKKRAVLWVMSLLLAVSLAGPWILKATDVIWKLRQDSSEVRFALYRYSLQQLEGVDWILGLGIKNRGDAFIYPIGSHSTYVSLCVKTGILGLLTFISFHAVLLRRWFQLKPFVAQDRPVFYFWRGLGWVFLAMIVWTMTEDLDAPQLVAFLYFSLVGVFEGMRRELLTR